MPSFRWGVIAARGHSSTPGLRGISLDFLIHLPIKAGSTVQKPSQSLIMLGSLCGFYYSPLNAASCGRQCVVQKWTPAPQPPVAGLPIAMPSLGHIQHLKTLCIGWLCLLVALRAQEHQCSDSELCDLGCPWTGISASLRLLFDHASKTIISALIKRVYYAHLVCTGCTFDRS